ncbi:retrovirus-related Pol polyprotein from transposon 297 [Tribolium castaneum]|uniref:retrovirus-related Pol polyprotein from transposon 297 n=1 Tax=Tribolium castaneum TaxID=7070 RepID=UPI0030FEE30E
MLKQGIIRPSDSPWSSPIWIVPKKLDASGQRKWRIVIDYRKLNEQTVEDRYPLPNINDILDKLGRSQYFSTIDLASGFHQIEVDPNDVQKTAFTVENGHYEFVRMPFGLKNAPSTFQRVMDNVLRGIVNNCCIVYLDDIIVFSTSLQEHIQKLTAVFDRLRKFNFKIQLDKSEFLKKEVNYLGHVITPEGIKPNPDKIKAILDYSIPTTPKQLKGFLGLIGYYRKFIKNFAKITKPLTIRLKKDHKIDPNETDYKNCFEFCKNLLTNDPILQYPDFDKQFILTTDASNYAIGAVLSQGTIGSDLPVAFASRTLNEHEINYSTIEKELLAIVWATKYFRPYLYGRKFKIVTDHQPLKWLFSLKEPNSKLVRWRLRLEEFDYEIHYKKGTLNSNADALSRPPNLNMATTPDNSEPETDYSDKPIFEYIKKFNQELINKEDDISSTRVEPDKDLEQTIDESDDNITIHTNKENPVCLIPISEDPLNFGKNQIQFISVTNNPSDPVVIKLFENSKQRITVQISRNDSKNNILNFIKNYVIPQVSYACHFASDELYEITGNILREHFNESILFKRHLKILEDVESPEEQIAIIQNYHYGKSNHRGINETLQKISSRYYWPNMQKAIQNFINKCEICKAVKYDRKPLKLKFNLTPTPTKPFEIVHIDVLKYQSHKFLTIIDAFSKYAQVYLLENMQAIEIMKKLLIFFSHHSVPSLIITDNGSEFDNGVVTEFFRLHKIDVHFCSPHHPASNGLIERFHSTFLEHLNLLNNRPEFSKDPISTKILYATIAYNNSIHSTTKLTPFNVLNLNNEQEIGDINLEYVILNNHLQSHKEKLQIIFKEINKRLTENKEKLITKLNENRENIPTKLPDTVFVKSNFRSKVRNRYKKEEILETNRDRKTIKPKINKSKTGRKFNKLHMDNVKRPTKQENSIAGTSS